MPRTRFRSASFLQHASRGELLSRPLIGKFSFVERSFARGEMHKIQSRVLEMLFREQTSAMKMAYDG